MATGNMHISEVRPCGFRVMRADRQINRHSLLIAILRVTEYLSKMIFSLQIFKELNTCSYFVRVTMMSLFCLTG